jgi:hypothetical protein
MEGAAVAESSRAGRKAYSCECIGSSRRPVNRSDLTPPGIPCRSRKVKVSYIGHSATRLAETDESLQCDRHQVCGQCKRKAIACEWPPNGVPIESEVDAPADYP